MTEPTKAWFNAAEFAAEKLPEMPTGERAIQVTAKREGWQRLQFTTGEPMARKRKGRGGGWEYHYSVLPLAAQREIIRRYPPKPVAVPEPKKGARSAETLAWFHRQSAKKQKKAKERAKILDEIEMLIRGGERVNTAVALTAREHGYNRSTVFGWRRDVAGLARADWLPILCPRHCGKTETKPCDPRIWDALTSDYLRPSAPSFTSCYDRTAKYAAEHGLEMPAARTLRRRVEQEIPKAVKVLARQGSEALKRLFPAQERDRSMFRAMQGVNADGHKADVFVNWPGRKKPVRPILVVIQDLYSGKILAWRADLSETNNLVRLTFGDLFRDWGIPEEAVLDNGRAFAAKDITGGQKTRYRFKVRDEDPRGVLTNLGVNVHWTNPYSGQSKPIERAFRDLCDRAWKHPAFDGAYTGGNPDAKPEDYGSRAVSQETFLKVVGQAIIAHNAQPNRRSRVCAGQYSFDEVFKASYESDDNIIKHANEHQLTMFLLAAEQMTARKDDGAIHLLGNRYWSPLLVEQRGRKLTVRYDPEDLHTGIHLYALDGRYLGWAECLEAAGFLNIEDAREHARARRDFHKATKQQLDATRRLTAAQVAALQPQLTGPEINAPKTVRGVFGAASPAAMPAEEIERREDEEAFWQSFSRVVAAQGSHLRVVEEDD